MRAFYKRFSVVAGFSALLVLLLINGLIIRHELAIQVVDQAWVRHTQDVLLQLQLTESLVKDAETGQRGYLYTGEPRYLAPYNQAIRRIDPEIDKLGALVVDNPQQATLVPQLRGLANQKLKELSATIALYNAGHADDARRTVLTNSGLATMDKIRGLIGRMQQNERELERVRSQAYSGSVSVTVACVYAASLLAGLGLIVLGWMILREMRLREAHGEQIRAREEWFRVTLTSIGDGVIVTDEVGDVTFINPIGEKLTGRTLAEAHGKPIAEVFPIFNELTNQPVDNPVSKVMQAGRIVGLANHTVLQHRDGSLTPIEDSAAPIRNDRGQLIGVVLVFRDATAERKSQELLRKTEKIAAAARLAATVAHEINNPLEAVGNLIFLAKARPGLPAESVAELAMAEQELKRVSHVTRQTLGFYRESVTATSFDVPRLVENILNLYASKLMGKQIKVRHDLQDCPPLLGWPGELQQVIANLVSNAADAMGRGGNLKVTVSCVGPADDKAVQVQIADDGLGIAPEHLERIFEPFFTTKKDVGTGLGLWVARQIVERHGGKLTVESSCEPLRHGTVFTMLIPCANHANIQVAAAV